MARLEAAERAASEVVTFADAVERVKEGRKLTEKSYSPRKLLERHKAGLLKGELKVRRQPSTPHPHPEPNANPDLSPKPDPKPDPTRNPEQVLSDSPLILTLDNWLGPEASKALDALPEVIENTFGGRSLPTAPSDWRTATGCWLWSRPWPLPRQRAVRPCRHVLETAKVWRHRSGSGRK